MDTIKTLSMALVALAAGGLLLAGCGLDPDGDEDGDGLSNGDEEAYGTDPEVADTDGDGLNDGDEVALGANPLDEDTDGDGYDDGDEVEGNTDPLDEVDHPYLGGWPIGDCRADVVPTGNDEGDIAENFQLMDQFGEYVRFHDLCDQVILLHAGAFT